MAAILFLLIAALGAGMGVLVILAFRVAVRKLSPQYVFRFREEPGLLTLRDIPPNAIVEASTECPFCKRPAKALGTRYGARVECRDCGVLDGTADEPGLGSYTFRVGKPPTP